MIYLRIYPEYFNAIIAGKKPFEIRNDSKRFKVGDSLVLKEIDFYNKFPTGRSCIVKVKNIFYLDSIGLFGYCAFTFDICSLFLNDLPLH